MFRELKATEIEARVGQASEKGLSLLLYKDARVDMAILDETVGQARWQREHYEVKGNLFCRVGIEINGQWIWKADCGTESNTEAEKGESSDSFKRACVNWGIGRELYTAPFIWVPASDVNLKEETGQNGKKRYSTKDHFSVTEIEIKDKAIVGLKIKNDTTGKAVYYFGTLKTEKKAQIQNDIPFPEAGTSEKPEISRSDAILHQGQTKNATIDEKRDWAKNFKPYGTMTLAEIRKMNKSEYLRLQMNPPSIECASAIQILDEWIKATQ